MTTATTYTFKHLERFVAFITERHRIYQRRKAHEPAPWTRDPILATYRFCNVYRELDRTTQWIEMNWRTPYQKLEDLWFAMVVARFINHPPTLSEFSLPGKWSKSEFLNVMDRRRTMGEKAYGSAYIIATSGESMDKAVYLGNYVLDPMWKKRDTLRPRKGDTLQAFYSRLMENVGMGSFMTAQVIADMKYVAPLLDATDWWTFAASGPGSRRGMSYLMGYDPRTPWKEHEWRDALAELAVRVKPRIKEVKLPRLHAQDLQNCLCEFSKYRRTQLKTGRPKQKFVPYDGEWE